MTKKITIEFHFTEEVEDFGDETYISHHLYKISQKSTTLTESECEAIAEHLSQTDNYYTKAVYAVIEALEGITTQFKEPI